MLAWIAVALANPYAKPAPVAADDAPFTWEVPAFAAGGRLEIALDVPEGFAVYQDGLVFEAAPGPVTLGEPILPEAKLATDPSDPTRTRALWETDVRVVLPVKGAGELVLSLTHQGCRAGLCWPPTTTTHVVKVIGG